MLEQCYITCLTYAWFLCVFCWLIGHGEEGVCDWWDRKHKVSCVICFSLIDAHILITAVLNIWNLMILALKVFLFITICAVVHILFLCSESSPWTCQSRCPMRSVAWHASLTKWRLRWFFFLFPIIMNPILTNETYCCHVMLWISIHPCL